ncbi:MAG: tRNA (adenosine(37)-N6)-threonylcarbamoyltransferase complex ATPase subunit type 1 TsaE [Gammaproteobacteria bacterium]|nr:tRNA (adenosine(37)-N6)-threonylcarbamoyltransferase complex ATPase subunit type 1 TsaE [Gammaproteobacteria bacterium]
MKQQFLADSQATEQWAAQLAPCLNAPFVLTLRGEIGAGKTTFVRALLRQLGYQAAVKSPTFSIVETYVLPSVPWVFHHFDLYRILEDDLDVIGFRDYFTEDAVCCIEWPERAGRSIGLVDLDVLFDIDGEGRLARLSAETSKGHHLINQIVS